MAQVWYELPNKQHGFGKDIVVNPDATIFIPAAKNYRVEVKSNRRIILPDALGYEDMQTSPIFWKENLVESYKGTYLFETKYCSVEDILSLDDLDKIPKNILKEFLKRTSRKTKKLANRLMEDKTDIADILLNFYDYIVDNKKEFQKSDKPKPIDQLIRECEADGFVGNCKDARDLYVALCNAVGIPAKKVSGKSYMKPGGHVWAEAIVPTRNGFGLLSSDPALNYFEILNPNRHLYFEVVPKQRWGLKDNLMLINIQPIE